MTASTQSPPAASTLAPTSAAFRDCAATISAFGDHRRFADLLGVAELVVHGVAFAVVHIR